jgi:hypothetical protein
MVGRSETGARIQAALQRAGVEFIDENGGGWSAPSKASKGKIGN